MTPSCGKDTPSCGKGAVWHGVKLDQKWGVLVGTRKKKWNRHIVIEM